ncbi:MAG TPA: MOSC and FAD-binding oxidoreductase domain-containing protein [Candidatus Limnocylindria bacterium]|nr:MOSC and FAD-binding oxidoreductase domain-containing protein [Candidatus Limnocylindria bacterium]
MARLLSVNVGLPRDVAWHGQTVRTAIWKSAVEGPRLVRQLNVEGDGQGDLRGHGGEQRAVLVYQIASYRFWEDTLGRNDFAMGQFGENFTVDGLSDDEVCIGDRYRIGGALFEVTQPRVTCYRVGIRMNEPQMAALLVARNRPGFYLRVLQEGQVDVGDAIEKVADGPEHVTVAALNALLYLPGHTHAQVERALRIPALSPGWRTSLQALIERPDDASGNPGLAPPDVVPAAWAGFRPMRIAALTHETSDVVSVELEAPSGAVLPIPLPGQFVVVRLQPEGSATPVMRSFSLCGPPSSTQYRLGIKCEPHGIAGTYLAARSRVGELLEVSAPRGAFVLQADDTPAILLSAGIGATPVLAMLHALAAEHSQREIWWIHGARSRAEHPFAAEVRGLLAALPRGRAHVRYSRPGPQDERGRDYDSSGRLDAQLLAQLDIARESDFYLCGPPAFLDEFRAGLAAWGVAARRIRSEVFGSGPAMTPGIVGSARRAPHAPADAVAAGPLVSFARSSLAVHWDAASGSLLELAEACDVPVRWSCRTGVCHSCESGLISGTVRYAPDPLEAPAAGNLLLCCSRPDGDVVLDI